MFFIGLDLGKKRDHSAIAVVERRDVAVAWQTPRLGRLELRYLERVALGTPYPQVVARVQQIVGHQELRGRCALVVDSTGVGEPVMDMLRRSGLGCEVVAVTITGGENQNHAGQKWNVPKQDLVMGVQVLLEGGTLKISPGLKDYGALVRELMDMRSAQGGRSGRVRLGADGYGQHDDLAMALALACWKARQARNGFRGEPLPGL